MSVVLTIAFALKLIIAVAVFVRIAITADNAISYDYSASEIIGAFHQYHGSHCMNFRTSVISLKLAVILLLRPRQQQ